MTTFTVEDIRGAFSQSVFERGQHYQRQGRVMITNADAKDGPIEGEVQGTARAPYQVSAAIRRLGTGRLIVGGECTCPVGFGCKHIAALLLHVLAGRNPQVDIPPVPRLHLFQRSFAAAAPSRGRKKRPAGEVVTLPLARLSFCYGKIEVASAHSRDSTLYQSGSRMVELARHYQAERQAKSLLDDMGFHTADNLPPWLLPPDNLDDLTLADGFDAYEDQDAWLDVIVDRVPQLIAEGWRIDVDPDFPFRLAIPQSDIEAELKEGRGIDWFDLHMGVLVDGQRLDILPALLKVLRQLPAGGLESFFNDRKNRKATFRLPLEDGRILPLPLARLRPIVMALTGVYVAETEGAAIGFTRADAADFTTLVDVTAAHGVVWRGGENLRQLGLRLKNSGGVPAVTVPPLFCGTLRPYQQAGVAWMQMLREVQLGGVLADDMGLGKTVQTLAHIAIEKQSGRADRPCLIVAPTSVLPNWLAEAATFTPGLTVLALHGSRRNASFARIEAADIVLTTYPLLARDSEVLTAERWHMVIIDEAQAVKNPATAASVVLRRLECRFRLALTGTPIENHLGELWALFDFVSPGFLGDAKSFVKNWRTPIEKKGDGECQALLARRVRPFLLRRTKDVVAAELPPKTEIIEHIEMSSAQRDLYEGIRLAMHQKVREAIAAKGLRGSRIELLDALLKLRQVCCDPRLVKSDKAGAKVASAKLQRVMEMLPELIEEGRRILLFSQFTSMLSLLEAELKNAGMPYLLLTGETQDRATPVKTFQSGTIPLFLISLKAGGSGLNLTAADTVIHYDPWWNPAVEAQATDRAHRIGQTKPVFVHKLVVQNTIEVKMADLKARKQALSDGLFGTAASTSLDVGEDDIEFLLGGG